MLEYRNKYKIGVYDKYGRLQSTYWSKTYQSEREIKDWTTAANRNVPDRRVKLLAYKQRSQAEISRPKPQTSSFGFNFSSKGNLPRLLR
jgi:hypothetical protein